MLSLSSSLLTTTTASPMTVMMPKGTSTIPTPAPSTDAMGSCVEFRPVSLADEVTERKVVLDVMFSGSVLGSAELVRTGKKVVRESVGAGNGVRVWVEVNMSGLVVVRDMALAGRRRGGEPSAFQRQPYWDSVLQQAWAMMLRVILNSCKNPVKEHLMLDTIWLCFFKHRELTC